MRPDKNESGAAIETPDGELVIVKVTGSDDDPCDVEVDAPDDYTVKRF
jgi:hypothetical protein